MYDDAKFIHDFITELSDDGKEVIILAHSYGGCPASESLKGLTKNERTAVGKSGGVVRVAYLTAVVPKVGENTVETVSTSGSGGAPQVEIDQYGWMNQTDREKTGKMVFNSLSSEESIARSKSFGPHGGPAFMAPLTHPGYQDVGISARRIVRRRVTLTSVSGSC
jgi:hypothetical protein